MSTLALSHVSTHAVTSCTRTPIHMQQLLFLAFYGLFSLGSLAIADILNTLASLQLETRETRRENRETQNTLASLQLETRETRTTITELFAGKVLTSASPNELGLMIWNQCELKANGVDPAIESIDIVPLVSEEELNEMKERFKAMVFSKEEVWTALITPYLQRVVKSTDKVLVNSERIGWIRTQSGLSTHYQKPDLFVSDPLAFIQHPLPEPRGKPSESAKYAASLRTNDFLFGECAWPLRDSLSCILEIKVNISLNQALGEALSKVSNILHSLTISALKVCLIDMNQVYLLVFTSTGLFSSRQFLLTAKGSFRSVKDFISPSVTIEPVWLRATRQLCKDFNVEPVRGSAFLGAGAHGKVFRVERRSSGLNNVPPADNVYALKVVDCRHKSDLEAECRKLNDLLRKASATNDFPTFVFPTFVSPFIKYAFAAESNDLLGCGMLLQPVGEWFCSNQLRPKLESARQQLLFKVLEALVHMHRVKVVHGDARLENLICLPNDRLIWIDFRETMIPDTEVDGDRIVLQQLRDLNSCVNNFIYHYYGSRESAKLSDLYERYKNFISGSESLESAGWQDFKTAIWKKIEPCP